MITKHLQAIEFISQDNWQAAHELVQHGHDELAFMIHGYLHRQQRDLSNANYWYNPAGKIQPSNMRKQELERLYQLAKSGINEPCGSLDYRTGCILSLVFLIPFLNLN